IATYEYRDGNARPCEPGKGYGIAFHGTNGTLFVDRSGYEIFAETRGSGNRAEPRTAAEQAKSSNNHGEAHARNFLDCMKSRELPISDIQIGHRSTTACLLGNIAHRTRERFRWDAAKEQVLDSKAAARMLSREYRAPWKLRV